jgi:hypothetical protein
MGVRYVKQGLQWLAGKGFQQKWAGKLFLEAKRNFTKISFLKFSYRIFKCELFLFF